ncbi:hypothetical protein [Aquipuribacter hungaricus]|uniref:TNase-like domain-containing protein n=1 Tax=Aquipuribacter hungaricus TaxID=545624 RepID=A0ABV7WI14_9MICO
MRGSVRSLRDATVLLTGMLLGGCVVGVTMSGEPGEVPVASAPSSDTSPAEPTRSAIPTGDEPTDEPTGSPSAAPEGTVASAAALVPAMSPTPTPAPPPPAPPPSPAPQPDAWVVVDVIDGDTLDARRDGVVERVRVVGLDTPEQGQCGFDEAARRSPSSRRTGRCS